MEDAADLSGAASQALICTLPIPLVSIPLTLLLCLRQNLKRKKLTNGETLRRRVGPILRNFESIQLCRTDQNAQSLYEDKLDQQKIVMTNGTVLIQELPC